MKSLIHLLERRVEEMRVSIAEAEWDPSTNQESRPCLQECENAQPTDSTDLLLYVYPTQ